MKRTFRIDWIKFYNKDLNGVVKSLTGDTITLNNVKSDMEEWEIYCRLADRIKYITDMETEDMDFTEV